MKGITFYILEETVESVLCYNRLRADRLWFIVESIMNFESKSIRNGQTWEREKCLLRFLEGNQNQDQEKMLFICRKHHLI